MFIHHRKKAIVLIAVTGFVAVTILAFSPIQMQPEKFKNLKVLPADISFKQMDDTMDQFEVDLGIQCNYCHAHSRENNRKMDMASDDNKKKDIARDMMRMTNEMNRKYMANIPHADTVKVQLITCNTCHRGAAKPTDKSIGTGLNPHK